MQIITLVSDRYLNALKGHAFLFNRYFGSIQNVTVCGFTPPSFELPRNFKFSSLGDFSNFPVDRWSDAFIKVLDEVAEDIFLLLLEDYFLTRQVDFYGLSQLYYYMQMNPNVVRLDLTSDRLYAQDIKDYDSVSHFDLIQSLPTNQYQLSTQAGFFRRDLLKQVVIPNESAGQLELRGTSRLNERKDLIVLGTRQSPIRYLISIQQGRVTLDGGYQLNVKLKQSDLDELRSLGFLDNLITTDASNSFQKQ